MIARMLDDKMFFPPDDVSSIKKEEAVFIYDFIKKNNLKKTLETGFAYGRSAAHIISASQTKHIAIDPFQNRYDNCGIKNIESANLTEMLEFYNDFSHHILPKLALEKKTFDFIFIDGDHKFDGIFVDFYYSDLLLENNGFIMFHDTWMRSTQLVISFIKSNRNDYSEIKSPLKNISIFKKTNTDNRNGMFFKEFYTFKSYIKFKIIMWFYNNQNNRLRNLVYKSKKK